MEISYNELRTKEVVNLVDGSRMGKIIDMIVSTSCKEVLGIVVVGERRLFRPNEDIFIPWKNINKIGDDVILVCIELNSCANVVRSHNRKDDCVSCGGRGDYREEARQERGEDKDGDFI